MPNVTTCARIWIISNLGARLSKSVGIQTPNDFEIIKRWMQMKKLLVTSLSLSVFLAGCSNVTNEGVGTVTGGVVGPFR